jgi:lipopolysaccharide transport system ATP-binding protein
MKPAIEVNRLSKQFRLGKFKEGYRTLRETLAGTIRGVRHALQSGVRPTWSSEQFWALRDVSFNIPAGEVVGIVGRNGSGKSTLLKVLSRIYEPTYGEAIIRGRVGSLLEVGTGFHPELTGRENIYLNGAILGMRRAEITRKFDEIVNFAEVDAFLDTPVKRYSSGMYVRLAFAVAAHLEPEILIVDEVLAVGDVAFQRKCMGRMSEIGRSGRTVLFVSHNMAAIEALCSRAILLDRAQVVVQGKVSEVLAAYYRALDATTSPRGFTSLAAAKREDSLSQLFQDVCLLNESGHPTTYLPLGEQLRLRIGLATKEMIEHPTLAVSFDDAREQRLLTVQTPLTLCPIDNLEGRCHITCLVDNFPLAPGEYSLTLGIAAKGAQLDYIRQAMKFTVVNSDMFGEGRGFHRGVCVAPSRWLIEAEPARGRE